jgi:hypothetical protein
MVVVRQAFERAGIELIDENGGGPGVRMRKRQRAKPSNGPWASSRRASHKRRIDGTS